MIKKIKYFIEYYSLACFAALFRSFPIRLSRFKARCLADFAYYVLGIRKKVVLGNLSAAFPEKSVSELKTIGRNVYRQFATTMMELLYFPRWKKEDLDKMVSINGKEVLDEARKGGKGAVLVTGHFGNWELLGASLAGDYPMNYVIGRQKNTRVDDLLNSFRTGKGIKLIPLKVALRGVMQALKKGEFLAILSDQDAHELGTFVNFFGRPASTPKGPAIFALRAGCPLIFGSIVRFDGKFKANFEVVPKPQPTGDEEKDIQAYTQAYTIILEGYCRKYPDHWFWLHRRWKTHPSPR